MAAVALLALGVGLFGAGLLVGSGGEGPQGPRGQIGAEGISLVAFDSCERALEELREAMLPHVGPYGLGGGARAAQESVGGPAAPGAAPPDAPGLADRDAKSGEKAPEHSTTNTHESGVDEPDLVKTDGRRLVTVADGMLRVADVASRAVTATLRLPGGQASQLLLHDDHALVMTGPSEVVIQQETLVPPRPGESSYATRLVLVDLAGGAAVRGSLAVEGDYVDARQVGSVARVVVRSAPRLGFVSPHEVGSEGQALARNREIVMRSTISDWLPRFELTGGGDQRSGQLVDCAAVSRPASYTATAMLTVLTIDLASALTTGDPVSIVADGDTVYGTGTSLYVADDHVVHRTGGFAPVPLPPARPKDQRTEIYQFDVSRPGKPVYVASGSVAGALLNQYSLSEHAGHLRVATTVGDPRARTAGSESVVTVLARKDDALVRVGSVGGLGVGERIYAVRFVGPVGFVVTFRQTDPLYTVDLSDPRRPRVLGELKITGYSAYLHAAGKDRLIGIGQEATEQGRRTGTQVVLFDTADLASPRRVAQYHLPGGSSEAEGDPHAFLYWPQKDLVVIPVSSHTARRVAPAGGGALVLRLEGDHFTELTRITHPVDSGGVLDGSVRRTLVIGAELWTVSAGGVMVHDIDRLSQLSWVPFT